MKNRTHRFYLMTLSLLVALAGAASAQQEKKPQTSVRFESGLTVNFTSETDPPGSSTKSLGGSVQIKGEDNIIHRVFVDRTNKIYFGYDLEVVPTADSNQFRLTVKPLSVPPLMPPGPPRISSGSGADGGRAASPKSTPSEESALTPLALLNYPAPQILRDGETLALDVLVNSQTGVKIIDLIKISSTSQPHPSPSPQSGQPYAESRRAAIDLTPELIEFKFTASRLLVNGQAGLDEEQGATIGISGTLVWFYVPGHGRFILSLVPRKGYDFQKIGVVAGGRLSFTFAGNQYEWFSSSPIVTSGSNNWNLWVLHDPDYRPILTEADTPYIVGAVDRIEFLLKKK